MNTFIRGLPNRSPPVQNESSNPTTSHRQRSRSHENIKRKHSTRSNSSPPNAKPKQESPTAAKGRPDLSHPSSQLAAPTWVVTKTKQEQHRTVTTDDVRLVVTLHSPGAEDDLTRSEGEVHLSPMHSNEGNNQLLAPVQMEHSSSNQATPEAGQIRTDQESHGEVLQPEARELPPTEEQSNLRVRTTESPPTQEATASVATETQEGTALKAAAVQTTPSLMKTWVKYQAKDKQEERQNAEPSSTTASPNSPASYQPLTEADKVTREDSQPSKKDKAVAFHGPPKIYRKLAYHGQHLVPLYPRPQALARNAQPIVPVLPWWSEQDGSDSRTRGETGPGGIRHVHRDDRTTCSAQLCQPRRSTAKDWSTGYRTTAPAYLHVTLPCGSQTQADKVKRELDNIRRGFDGQDLAMDNSDFVDIQTMDSPPISKQAMSTIAAKEESGTASADRAVEGLPPDGPGGEAYEPGAAGRGAGQVEPSVQQADADQTESPEDTSSDKREGSPKPWDHPGEPKLDPSKCVMQ